MTAKVKIITSDDEINNLDDSSSQEDNKSDESGDDNSDESQLDNSSANPGWADAMRKILNTKKPKKKKSIVLSKAKKLSEVKPKTQETPVSFEIETKDGKIKREVIKTEDGKTNTDDTDVVESRNRRKKSSTGIRVKPSVLDRERESRLKKIATK